MSQDLRGDRREYLQGELSRSSVAADPFAQFTAWFEQAKQANPVDATAMILATAGTDALPTARVVLLKHYDASGFCWYTDYRSAKGQQLAENPHAQILFYWPQLERQVRISGRVTKLDRAKAEIYFHSRPEGSRYSAAISQQSAEIDGREQLQQKLEQARAEFPAGDVPCPEAWGGYCLEPNYFEFWQGRESRLHDRICYELEAEAWRIVRIQP